MEFLRSFLRRYLAGKPVVEFSNVGCFLGLRFLEPGYKTKRFYPHYLLVTTVHPANPS